MYRFIAQRNIAHFENLLRTDLDPKRRAILFKLLIAEETNLGKYSLEHLAQVDGHIARIEELIANQRDVVAKLNGDGRAAAPAEDLLDRLVEAHGLWASCATDLSQRRPRLPQKNKRAGIPRSSA
jgi:hypothetical protein